MDAIHTFFCLPDTQDVCKLISSMSNLGDLILLLSIFVLYYYAPHLRELPLKVASEIGRAAGEVAVTYHHTSFFVIYAYRTVFNPFRWARFKDSLTYTTGRFAFFHNFMVLFLHGVIKVIEYVLGAFENVHYNLRYQNWFCYGIIMGLFPFVLVVNAIAMLALFISVWGSQAVYDRYIRPAPKISGPRHVVHEPGKDGEVFEDGVN